MDVLKIFIISLVSDLDNIIIYVSVLRKYAGSLLVVLVITATLTINRTISITLLHELYSIPWVEFSVGIILLIIALKMTSYRLEMLPPYRSSSLWKVVATVVLLDLVLSIDGVLIVSDLSREAGFIYMGIALSLLTLFMFSSLVFKIVQFFPWIFVVVASFISYAAMENIFKKRSCL
ncbi:MAG: hypothetical protein LRY73_17240 [Bacillus sp. (in: Bacteria)]|nr:hypothetical protein [Bacillus sp. (in: firmicutes)]